MLVQRVRGEHGQVVGGSWVALQCHAAHRAQDAGDDAITQPDGSLFVLVIGVVILLLLVRHGQLADVAVLELLLVDHHHVADQAGPAGQFLVAALEEVKTVVTNFKLTSESFTHLTRKDPDSLMPLLDVLDEHPPAGPGGVAEGAAVPVEGVGGGRAGLDLGFDHLRHRGVLRFSVVAAATETTDYA